MRTMQILHTPWRKEYVVATQNQEGCVFCDLLASEKDDQTHFILHRGKTAFLVLNIYPYTPGHLMAVPYRHIASTAELKPDELPELLHLCQLGEKLLRRTYGCRSVHTGANLGRAAGAGVPGHMHFHIVAWPEDPLWERCQGQMEPGETLEETFRQLRETHSSLGAG